MWYGSQSPTNAFDRQDSLSLGLVRLSTNNINHPLFQKRMANQLRSAWQHSRAAFNLQVSRPAQTLWGRQSLAFSLSPNVSTEWSRFPLTIHYFLRSHFVSKNKRKYLWVELNWCIPCGADYRASLLAVSRTSRDRIPQPVNLFLPHLLIYSKFEDFWKTELMHRGVRVQLLIWEGKSSSSFFSAVWLSRVSSNRRSPPS